MVLGSGKNSSLFSVLIPAPNCICKTPVEVSLVTNLLGTLFNLSTLGARALSSVIFFSPTNTVSCPKNGTSYHKLPSLSVISNMPTISASSIESVANFSDVVNDSCIDFTLPENAFVVFLRRN